MREIDPDFAAYVRSRQHRLLRAAYLVCGDIQRAQDLLQQAVEKLSLRWDTIRDEQPDAFLRRALYRDAVSASRRTRHEELGIALPERPDAAHDVRVEARVELEWALAQLTARQRAVLVLRYVEDRREAETADVLGVGVGTVRSQTHDALARIRLLVPRLAPARPSAERDGPDLTTSRLGALLDDMSSDVLEVDLADRAWQHAQQRRARARRRAAVVVAAAAVIGATTWFAAGPPSSRPGVTTTPRPGFTTVPTLGGTAPDGTPYVVAPGVVQEPGLPFDPIGLPELVTPAGPRPALDGTPRPVPARGASRLAAVLLRAVDRPEWNEATTFHALLVSGDGGIAEASVPLHHVSDSRGETHLPLTPGSVSPDGARVAFAQPGQVLVLDAVTGATSGTPVPSRTVQRVHWIAPSSLVASGDEGAWLVDLGSRPARVAPAPHGWVGATNTITASTDGVSLLLDSFSASGGDSLSVRAPATQTWGETFSSTVLAASGVFFPRDVFADPRVVEAYEGILAVPVADVAGRRILVLTGLATRYKGCCPVLGVVRERTVVFVSSSIEGLRVLTWDTRTGQVMRAMQVALDSAVPPVVALGVGDRR